MSGTRRLGKTLKAFSGSQCESPAKSGNLLVADARVGDMDETGRLHKPRGEVRKERPRVANHGLAETAQFLHHLRVSLALHVLTPLFQRGLVTRVLGDTGLQILMSLVRSSVGLLVCSGIPRDLC